MVLKSFAKLNLFLEVLKKRPDSYHNILTVFERIDLSDKIIITRRPDKKIKVSCNLSGVPKDKTNLCFRSAKLLQDKFKVNQGLNISIIKRIPVGAGLGGGSSNAAAVLLGLNKFWRLNLKQNKLVELAKTIGSDCAFFIYNVSFARGSGRGEKIRPLRSLKQVKLWHLLVVPKIKVPTPFIYRKWDEFSALTRAKYTAKILTLALRQDTLALSGKGLFNSLEAVTSRLYPQINRIKERMKEKGAQAILMSGSGPAVFAILSSRKEALALSRQLKRGGDSWQVFVARTI